MPEIRLKEKLIEDIETLPERRVKEVIEFIEYLKVKEDDWLYPKILSKSANLY